MSIYIPRKKEFWLEKPSGAQELNYSNWAAEGLTRAFYIDTNGYYSDLTGNSEQTFFGGSVDTVEDELVLTRLTSGVSAGVKPYSNGNLSVSARLKHDDNDFGLIVSADEGADRQFQFGILAGDTGALRLIDWSGGSISIQSAPATVPVGEYHTAGFTRDSSVFDIYYDGGQIHTVARTGAMDTSPLTDLVVGNNAQAEATSGIGAHIAHVWLWGEAVLTEDQHAEIATAPYQILKPRKTYFLLGATPTATLSGTLSGRGSLSSGISTQILLNGDFAARAAIAGDLSTEILLLGGPFGLAQLSGDILTQVLLNAITTGSATLSADLSAGNEILLSGDIAGAALINADIATQVLLDAGLSAEAALTADLLTQIALAGGLTGSATVSGNLTVGSVITLSGAVSGEASLTAELLTDILLSAAVAGQATVVGALTIPADDLQAAISGAGTITGTLDTGILMRGALAGSASITGLIITEQMQDVVGLITLETLTPRIALVTKTPKITLH